MLSKVCSLSLGIWDLIHTLYQLQLISDETDVADADADLGDGEEEESAIDDDKTNEDDKDKEGDKPDGPRKCKLTLLNILTWELGCIGESQPPLLLSKSS